MFEQQVTANNVDRVSTQGEAIEGHFKKPVTYPPKGKKDSETASNFETQIPTFAANTDTVFSAAQGARRHDRGRADQRRPRHAAEPDPGLRPGHPARRAVRLARPARGLRGPMGALGNFGRRRARRVEARPAAGHVQRRRRHRRGQGGADRDRRLPQEPRPLPQARRAHPARRAAVRAARAPARRCWPAPSPARPACRSSRSRRRSSSRRSSASARRACATSSSRPRRPRRRSSSSTSSTRSAARARRLQPSAAATTSASRRSTRSSPRWTASSPTQAVIVLGATNRPEVLDAALLRPGRFDRRVAVPPPDKDGRQQILEVHTRSLPLADDVDLDRLAVDHAGHGRRRPGQPRQRGGAAPPRAAATRRSRWPTSPTRWRRSCSARRAAWCCPTRSAGASPTTRPGTRWSACSRRAPTRCARSRSSRAAMALGVTLARARRRPRQLRGGLAAGQDQGRARRPRRRGGRVRHDHHRRGVRHPAAHRRSRASMVGRWGMSRADRADRRAARPKGRARCCRASREASETTQRLVDEEVRRIVEEAHAGGHAAAHASTATSSTSLTEALLRDETLDEDAAYAAARVDRMPRGARRGRSRRNFFRVFGVLTPRK